MSQVRRQVHRQALADGAHQRIQHLARFVGRGDHLGHALDRARVGQLPVELEVALGDARAVSRMASSAGLDAGMLQAVDQPALDLTGGRARAKQAQHHHRLALGMQQDLADSLGQGEGGRRVDQLIEPPPG